MSATKTNPLGMKDVLPTLRSQQAGFRFGQPQRLGEKSLAVVLPILREHDDPRNYITFPETEKVEVTDTGNIQEMIAWNRTEENVFLRSGTIFSGRTQSRALQRSYVLLPDEKTNLPVRCVHASHGISPGSAVKYDGVTPVDFDKANYDHGYHFKDQVSTWSNVAASTTKMFAMNCSAQMSAGETTEHSIGTRLTGARQRHNPEGFDNLTANVKNFAENFDHILKQVKRETNQVGLAVLTDGGVQTVELFDQEKSWTALHDAAIKRLGPDLCKTDPNAVFKPDLDKVVSAVDAVLALSYKFNLLSKNEPMHDDPLIEVVGMTAEKYVGEMVFIDGKMIHLVLLQTT